MRCVRLQSQLVPCQQTPAMCPGGPAVHQDPPAATSAVRSPCALRSIGFLPHLSKMEKCPLGTWPPQSHPAGKQKHLPGDREQRPGACDTSGYHSASLRSQRKMAKGLQRTQRCLCPWGSTIQRLFPCDICSDGGSKKPPRRWKNKRQELVFRINGCLSFRGGKKERKER